MLTYEDIRHNERICALIETGNRSLSAMGYTEHGYAHAGVVSQQSCTILDKLGYDERTCELARIAGFMHDIGNAVNRANHAMSGATLAFQILCEAGMPNEETTNIINAIGNHDDSTANAVSPLSAAIILADKSDVRRSRVQCRPQDPDFDIHDRVNYAVIESSLTVDSEQTLIRLQLTIDTAICPVMDYFEIFLSRMVLCRRAAAYLGQSFELVINDTRML